MSGYQEYLFTYRFQNKDWSFKIPARSPQEARDRLQRLPLARYDGVLKIELPVPAGGLLLRLWRILTGKGIR